MAEEGVGLSRVIEEIAERIHRLRLPYPVRVAVDGRTASGKTTFADALAAAIEERGRTVIRASVDGFHRPRIDRHRQGRFSPDGYYEDARDLEALRRLLLDPLGPGGDRRFARVSFDLERDVPIAPVLERAPEDAVLIVDGTFLQRPELNGAWDFTIFLDVPAQEARRRGVERDAIGLGGHESALELYRLRYGPAFDRYQQECQPAEKADVIVGDAFLQAPGACRFGQDG